MSLTSPFNRNHVRWPGVARSASKTSDAANTDAASASHQRVVVRRRVLPGPRAVVGGLLIAVAAIGTYATATGAIASDSRSIVVASRDLTAGTRLTAADVRVADATIDADTARNLAKSARQIDGTILLGPLKSGEIIQASNVTAKSSSTVSPEVSFAIPRSRAVAGDLRSGEVIDVLVTDKGSTAEPARIAVSGATVVKIDKGANGSLASGGEVVVTLAVSGRSQAGAIATAVDQGQVTLVRTTGLTSQS